MTRRIGWLVAALCGFSCGCADPETRDATPVNFGFATGNGFGHFLESAPPFAPEGTAARRGVRALESRGFSPTYSRVTLAQPGATQVEASFPYAGSW